MLSGSGVSWEVNMYNDRRGDHIHPNDSSELLQWLCHDGGVDIVLL